MLAVVQIVISGLVIPPLEHHSESPASTPLYGVAVLGADRRAAAAGGDDREHHHLRLSSSSASCSSLSAPLRTYTGRRKMVREARRSRSRSRRRPSSHARRGRAQSARAAWRGAAHSKTQTDVSGSSISGVLTGARAPRRSRKNSSSFKRSDTRTDRTVHAERLHGASSAWVVASMVAAYASLVASRRRRGAAQRGGRRGGLVGGARVGARMAALSAEIGASTPTRACAAYYRLFWHACDAARRVRGARAARGGLGLFTRSFALARQRHHGEASASARGAQAVDAAVDERTRVRAGPRPSSTAAPSDRRDGARQAVDAASRRRSASLGAGCSALALGGWRYLYSKRTCERAADARRRRRRAARGRRRRRRQGAETSGRRRGATSRALGRRRCATSRGRWRHARPRTLARDGVTRRRAAFAVENGRERVRARSYDDEDADRR